MLDSLLTLTKRGAFWLGLAFVLLALMSLGVTALTGMQDVIFALGAIAALAALVVSATYTLIKRIFHLGKQH